MTLTITMAMTLAAALLIGVTVGLLGGGGSILTVPVLIYLAGMQPKPAIAASLFIVAVTSMAGLTVHARAGRVRWRTGAVFGMAGMAGAYAGGRVAGYLSATVLLVGFGTMMAVTAVAMLRPRDTTDTTDTTDHQGADPAPPSAIRGTPGLRMVVLLSQGFGVGAVTGLVGAGGGFMIVPALAMLAGLAMPAAIGTSLLVIVMQAVAGFAGHLHGVTVDWTLTLPVTGIAVVGALLGGQVSGRVNAKVLRKAFGWFVVVMALFVLTMQTPASLRAAMMAPAVSVPGAIMLTLALAGLVIWRRRPTSR